MVNGGLNRYASMYAGAMAGMVLSTGHVVATRLYPSAVFGTYPLLLAALAGLMLAGVALSIPRTLPPLLNRLLGPASVILPPILIVLLGEASAEYAFISGEYSVLNFVYLLLMQFVLVTLPLLLLGRAARMAQGRVDTAVFLGAAGLMLGVHAWMMTGMDVRLVFGIGAVLSFAGLLFTPTAESPTMDPAPASTQSEPPQAAESKAQSAHRKDRRGGKGARPASKPAPRAAAALALRAEAMALILLPLAASFFLGGQRLLEWGMPLKQTVTLLVPSLLIMIALGIPAGRVLQRRGGLLPGLAVLAALALSLTAGVWRIEGSIFAEVYTAYFGGTSSGVLLFETALWSILLPAFLAAAARAFFSVGNRGARTTDLLFLAGASAGLVAVVLFPEFVTATWTSAAAALFIGASLASYLRAGAWRIPAAAGAGILLMAALPILLTHTDGIRTLTPPERLQIRAEKFYPSGRISFLQSRDYDDPFHAALFNITTPMTADSRSVHNALYRFGHIPMLAHTHPSSVLLLGYGSGKVLEAVKKHKPARIVCVEPLDAYIWYADSTANREIRRSVARALPRHTERPAAYVARGGELFDVIISAEPFATPFPTLDIFSTAHYGRISARLRDDGVFAQWVPIASVSSAGLRSIAAAMRAVFPHCEMWLANADPENAMACFLGRKRAPSSALPPPSRFAALNSDETTAYHLRSIALSTPEELASNLGMTADGLARFAGDAAPLTAYAPGISSEAEQGSSDRWRNTFDLFAERSAPTTLLAALPDDSARARAEALFADRPAVLRAASSIAIGDDTTATRTLYDLVRAHPYNNEAWLLLGDVLTRRAGMFITQGNPDQAIPMLSRVIASVPLNTAVLRYLMIAAMQKNDKPTAADCIEGIKKLNGRHAGYRDNQATMRARQGEVNDALLLYENAITTDPSNEEFYCNMASLQYQGGRVWEAIRILDNAIAKAYYPAKAWYLKGAMYTERGKFDLAREAYEGYLRAALPTDPRRAEVEQSLAAMPK
ncbi:MAG: hypothetical protein HY962_03340 [Ignavibacteriae bacterium]|nr:hypothetical protein [Ignavibacteriota bacterium]